MRTPIICFALISALCMAMPVQAKGKKKNPPQEQKVALGVWEDVDKNATVESIIEWMKPLDEVGIKHYYMCGKPESIALYIEASKQYPGSKIHAWMFTLNYPGDTIAAQHPEWFDVNRLGYNSLEYNAYVPHYKWLSPSQPEARRYVKDKAASFAALEGLESVHLDYIRYCDVVLGRRLQDKKYKIKQDTYRAEYDFGYHPVTIEKFKTRFGYSPLDLDDPWMSPEWLQFRMNEVNSLVAEIVEETHAQGKKVSAAVFPFPTRSRMTVYQDWSAWDVDIVCPMNYNTFYYEEIPWIGFCVENGIRETGRKNQYMSGLFVPDLNKEELLEAVRVSVEAGADGINFFNARSLVRGDKLDVVKQIDEMYNR